VAVSTRTQLLFWGIGLAAFALFLWLLAGTLLPFLAGAAIAYFLDPVADRLERLGMHRVLATSIISLVAVLVFVLILLLAVPALVSQAQALAEAAPGYFAQAQAFLAARFPELFNEDSALREGLGSAQQALQESGMAAVNAVLVSSLKVIDFVVLMVVTPVVAFYLLLDWDSVVGKVNGWLPRQHAPTIRRLAGEIDVVMAGFVRGQLSVCLILGGFYALALMAIGLPFGFLVGLVAGLISFIPYVGTLVGGALSIGIALFAFWETPLWIFVTIGIFAFGQFVEGNVLSPNLVGKSVGLHPVWLIFALSVFGALFGFAGLLIAVPVAAALGVLGRFAVEQYLASPLYTGKLPPGEG
jgi:predicted PurR-regulated permease PerM